MTQLILNLLAIAALLFGLFFMSIGALGIYRLPDVYNRMHAAGKCVTLGIAGMLVAAAVALSTTFPDHGLYIITKVVLVIVFQLVAAPVGTHLLSKAAHLDGAELYPGTVADEMSEDKEVGSGV